jgi:hypothetical protein
MKTMRAQSELTSSSASTLHFDGLYSILECCESDTFVAFLGTCKTICVNSEMQGLTKRKKMSHYKRLDRGEHYVSMEDVADETKDLVLKWEICDNGGTPWSLRVLRAERKLQIVGEYPHMTFNKEKPNLGQVLWESDADCLGYWIGEDHFGKHPRRLMPGTNMLVEVGYRSYVVVGMLVRCFNLFYFVFTRCSLLGRFLLFERNDSPLLGACWQLRCAIPFRTEPQLCLL